jgi:hypothetical protein
MKYAVLAYEQWATESFIFFQLHMVHSLAYLSLEFEVVVSTFACLNGVGEDNSL